jgi:hypothetical protein
MWLLLTNFDVKTAFEELTSMTTQLDEKLSALTSVTATNTEKLTTLVTLTSQQNSLIVKEVQQAKELILGLTTTIKTLNAASPENLAGIDEQIIKAQEMANKQDQLIEMIQNNNAAIDTIIVDEPTV